MAVATHFELVQALYIACCLRPETPVGLLYWAEQIALAQGNASTVITAH